jgi:hypothetical protein
MLDFCQAAASKGAATIMQIKNMFAELRETLPAG